MPLDRQAQIEFLLDRYENPRYQGKLEDAATVSLEGGNPGCGDIVRFYLKFDGERLEKVSYEGQGCTISQASADILAEMIEGKTIPELEALNHEELMEILGEEIVQNRTRCALLSLDTLKLALRKYREQQVLKASS
jgi:nitrogen fixation NifU-like protein